MGDLKQKSSMKIWINQRKNKESAASQSRKQTATLNPLEQSQSVYYYTRSNDLIQVKFSLN